MNQAEKIRKLTLEILKNDNELLEDIEIDNKIIKGIKYSDLKNKLLSNTKYEFTDGGITGALYTLTNQVDSIFKIKIKKGVYYYYSSKKKDVDYKKDVILTESEDFDRLYSNAIKIYDDIGNILSKASTEVYKEVSETDIKYLRNILDLSSKLKESLRDYKNEISFDKMEKSRFKMDDLPF